jgi:hypothetical protein
MKQELSLSPESATNITELRLHIQNFWDNLQRITIQHLYYRVNAIIHHVLPRQMVHVCIDSTIWASLALTLRFLRSEFVTMYPYNNKLPVISLNKMTMSLRVLYFALIFLHICV